MAIRQSVKIFIYFLDREKAVSNLVPRAFSLRPRAVLETSGTVFPNMDLPAGEYIIFSPTGHEGLQEVVQKCACIPGSTVSQ